MDAVEIAGGESPTRSGHPERPLTVAQVLGTGERGGLLRVIALDTALPWVAVRVLEGAGVAMVPAFAAAALFPAASVALSWLRGRRVEIVGLAVAITLLLGATLAFVSNDVRFSVVKAAPAYGFFGITCLVSLFARRPLMFYVARYFTTGGDAARAAAFEAQLAIPGFVRSMRILTWVWGLVALAEAALGGAFAIFLPPQVALLAEPALAFATIAALLFWTVRFSRRRQARRGVS